MTTNKKNVNNKKFKFEIGEKILCYQDKHIYEAKCLNIRKSNTLIEYLIHYRGWKPKYDEWVLPDRILKYNQENIKLQQKLRQVNKEGKMKKLKKTNDDHQQQCQISKKTLKKDESKKLNNNNNTNDTNSSSLINHHNNLKLLNTTNIDIDVPAFIEKSENFLNKCECKIRIPEDLKTILTDDWELIINQKKLVHLPFKLNIDKILNEYFYNKSQSPKLPSNHSLDGYIDFLNSLRKYFNYFLDKCLLYPSERQQMEYLIKNYDEFSKTINKSDKSIINNGKESKRLMKKFRKISPKSIINLSSTSNSSLSTTKTNENDKKPSFNDQNSETSDSCTSTEVSSTEFQQNNNKLTPSSSIDFTKLYGAVHLLRLFTKLGEFIFYTDLNVERINLVNTYIYDFLKYLSKNLWLFANESDTSYIDSFLLVNK